MQYQRWMDKVNMSAFQDGSIDEGKAILREVLRMLVAYESLTRALMNSGEKYGHGREWSEEPDLPLILDSQKVFAIILGVYQLEQVGIAGEGWQFVKQVGRLSDGCSLGAVPEKPVDIFNLQDYLYRMSARSNMVDDDQASSPQVQIFTFLLHRHFNLRFQQSYICTHNMRERYLEFLADGAIFSSKPMMRGVVKSFNGPPVYACRMQRF